MARYEEPKLIKEDGVLGEIYTHPAFGCISISQTHGGSGTLFMSNVRHDSQIRFTVHRAKMARNHYQDQHYAEETIVEVTMSKVQFAELMAGMNQGGGVPCTLTRVDGTSPPGIAMENTNKRFAKEANSRFKELARQIDSIITTTKAALDEAKVSKAKQGPILSPLTKLEQDLRSNIPFMQDQFRESMEKIVSEAKSVVESYATELGMSPGKGVTLLSDGQ